MKLKPGNEAIYKQKHDEIWPEMLAQMERDGVRNFSIYRHGLTLFAYHGARHRARARRQAHRASTLSLVGR